MELIESFGLNWKLLLAQIINFLILLFILHRFLYKPLLSLLEKRKEKIEKGLTQAKEIEEEREKIVLEKEKEIKNAKKGALQIIEKARQEAEENQKMVLTQTKEEAEKILRQAKKEIENEKTLILSKVKEEIAPLVVLAAEKLIEKKLDEKSNLELVEKALNEIK